MIFTQFFRYITSITSMGVLKVVRNWKFEQGDVAKNLKISGKK